MSVSLRPVEVGDQPLIDRWAADAGEHMSRTRPCARNADRHDPEAGLYWYVIVEDDRDVGVVWIELPAARPRAVLGVFLGDPSDFGRGIGTAAVRLAVAEFRGAHPELPIALRVRRANTRAVACYRRAGFVPVGGGVKLSPTGDTVSYYRMVCPPSRPRRRPRR